MKREPCYHTRRQFLKTTLMGGALSATVPSFILNTMNSLHAATDGALTQPANGKDSPILVILQLAGGNDGLNTVVPIGNDHYYKARPSLSIAAGQTLKINDAVGLHPSLVGFRELYDEGHLGIVQAVGYPNPNRSHFKSMSIWHTASESEESLSTGWLGRYFDNQCSGEDVSVGIAIDKQAPEAFRATSSKGITFEDPNRYRFPDELDMFSQPEPNPMMHDGDESDNAGASIDMLAQGGASANGETPLDFLQRMHMNARVSSHDILAIAGKSKNQTTYPSSSLASELSLVSRLIAGGMPTRIYYVSHGGFDTHNQQAGAHDRLLRELAEALRAFMADLKLQGNSRRVLVLSFSEFGRRVQENGSKGTDHGAAAPLFLCGEAVRGGIHGEAPSLAPQDLNRGDVQHKIDFRSVYATVLQNHLLADPEPILRKTFPVLPKLLATPA